MNNPKLIKSKKVKQMLVGILSIVLLINLSMPSLSVRATDDLNSTQTSTEQEVSDDAQDVVGDVQEDELPDDEVGDVDTKCTCGTENNNHAEDCPLYVPIKTLEDMLNAEDYQSAFDTIMACEDKSEELEQNLQVLNNHQNKEAFSGFVAGLSEEQQSAFSGKVNKESTPECTCGGIDGIHTQDCPLYVIPENNPPAEPVVEGQQAGILVEKPDISVNKVSSKIEPVIQQAKGGGSGGSTRGDIWHPDNAFIEVQKTFAGIESAPTDYKIIVNGTEYPLSGATQDGLTYTWKITNLSTGNYTVKESGYTITGYDLEASVDGADSTAILDAGVTVSVQAAEGFISDTTVQNTNANNNYDLSEGVRVLNFNKANIIAVLSMDPLSVSERLEMEDVIDENASGAYKGTIQYYSMEELVVGETYNLNGATFEKVDDKNIKITSGTNSWNQSMVSTIAYTAAEHGDINIVNTYTKGTTPVTIEKQVTGSMGDRTKDFSFSVNVDKPMTAGEFTGYTVADNTTTSGSTITFNLKDNENISIADVPIDAILTITETNAVGYAKSYTVGEDADDDGVITVVDNMSTIVVTNDKDPVIDTGFADDVGPFIIMLVTSIFGITLTTARKRKRVD